jgi:hypothetical protein
MQFLDENPNAPTQRRTEAADDILWTTAQTAKFWNRCERTIARWVSDQLIPAPITIGENSKAFVAREQREALARMIAARDAQKAA